MMREWDVAGRCCAGRGWWCAMAWIFWCYWVSHIRSRILQFQSDCAKKMIPFHAIWGLCWYINMIIYIYVYIYIFFFPRLFFFNGMGMVMIMVIVSHSFSLTRNLAKKVSKDTTCFAETTGFQCQKIFQQTSGGRGQ